MVVSALVDDGQKTVTVPAVSPLLETALVSWSVISRMSALPCVEREMDVVLTVISVTRSPKSPDFGLLKTSTSGLRRVLCKDVDCDHTLYFLNRMPQDGL